ncbi:hypothetical protein BH160DRAFT_1843 [Burkholderia sp. H160]|nr:hypothetical protein BH160DRAFT_1843 [Burkholderia sp. H160]
MADGGYDDSNGNFWGRAAWIGLRSNFGTFHAGLQATPLLDVLFELDPRSLAQLDSLLPLYVNQADGIGDLYVEHTTLVYNRSKRTAVYAQVAFVNNKGNNNPGLNMGDGATTLFAPSGTTVGVNTGISTLF